MYVVRRSFRNYNQMMLPGSVVEPGNIKWFKTRLKDRVIVEINAHNFDQWFRYFKDKFGVELPSLNATIEAEDVVETPSESSIEDTEDVKSEDSMEASDASKHDGGKVETTHKKVVVKV